MKKKTFVLTICLILLCLGTAALFLSAGRKAAAVQNDLSDHILRFHVLANSDSDEDQTIKLAVRTAVIDYMEETLPEDADLGGTKAFITAHERTIRTIAENVIRSAGFDYSVTMSLEPWYFPTKAYGDMTFPCGTYEAFRIIIGNGEGQNWWCVLYPSLCFVDATHAVVPDDSREELRTILEEDTYESLLKEDVKPQIRFRFLDWLKETF